jgi:glycosyltransferase involved in cell wall biosynthesis
MAEIWPWVRAGAPDARCLIVGQKPAPAVQALERQAGCRVTGAVEDTRPYIAGASVYIAPLRQGGGTRFKLLEAMALGRPIVSTPVGAEGFPVAAGRELLIAASAAGFAQAVLRLLADRDLARQLGAAGRAFVSARYDWRVIVPALERVYASE